MEITNLQRMVNIQNLYDLDFKILSVTKDLFEKGVYHLAIKCNGESKTIKTILSGFGFEVEDINFNGCFWRCEVRE